MKLIRSFRGGCASLSQPRLVALTATRAPKSSKNKLTIENDEAPIPEAVVGEISSADSTEAPVKKTRKPRKTKSTENASTSEPAAAEDHAPDHAPNTTVGGDSTPVETKKRANKAPRSLGIKSPWGVDMDAEEQQAELQLYEASRPKTTEERRGRKKKAPLPPAAEEAIQVNADIEAKFVVRDQEGNPKVDKTALGEGKMATWAVGVYAGKEKKYIEAVQGFLLSASPLVDKETGQVIPRIVDFNLPTKKIRGFNEKTIKWSDKTIKYRDGGWIFVRGILDKELMGILSSTLYFQYFRNTLKVKFPFEDDVVEIPVPCTEEELQEIEAWKLHKNEEEEEMKKCEEYGGPVDVAIASQVIRRDEMEEDIDYDENGNKIYKQDFTGSYANPNNFYEPEPATKSKGNKKTVPTKEEPTAEKKESVSKKAKVPRDEGLSEDNAGWYVPPVPPVSPKSSSGQEGKGDEEDEALFGDWANDDLFKGLDDDLFSSMGRKGFQGGKGDEFDLGLGDGFDDFFDDEEDPFGLGRFDELPPMKSDKQGSVKTKGVRSSKAERGGFDDDWDDLVFDDGPGEWGDEVDMGSSKSSRSKPPPPVDDGRRGYGSSPPQRDNNFAQRGYQGGSRGGGGGGGGGGWSGQQDRRQDYGGGREDSGYGRYDDRAPVRERQDSGRYPSRNPNYSQRGRGGGGGGWGSLGPERGSGQSYDRPSPFDRFSAEDDMGGYMGKWDEPRKEGEEDDGFEDFDMDEGYSQDNRGGRGGRGGGGGGGRGGGRGYAYGSRDYEGGRGRGRGDGYGAGRGGRRGDAPQAGRGGRGGRW